MRSCCSSEVTGKNSGFRPLRIEDALLFRDIGAKARHLAAEANDSSPNT